MSSDASDLLDGAVEGTNPVIALVLRLMRYMELRISVAMPARVVTFDPTLRKATVRLEFLPMLDVRGEPVPDTPIPPIPLVPVRYPCGSLGRVEWPLAPDDTGHVIFTDRALQAWLDSGNPVAPVDPENGRAHSLADAVFEPGLLTDADAAASPVDMTATVVDGSTLVKVGAGATEFAVKGTTMNATLNTARGVLAAIPPSASPDPATITAVAGNKTAILAIIDALAAALCTKAMVE